MHLNFIEKLLDLRSSLFFLSLFFLDSNLDYCIQLATTARTHFSLLSRYQFIANKKILLALLIINLYGVNS